MLKKPRGLSLLVGLLAIVILTGSAPDQPEARAQQLQTGYQQTVVVLWNEVMLAAIGHAPPRPTVVARALFMVHVAMYDAWTAYDPVAVPTISGYVVRRPVAEHTEANKAAAVSQAAYHTLVALFPAYEESNQAFSRMMANLGYRVVIEGDPATPEGIGYLALKRPTITPTQLQRFTRSFISRSTAPTPPQVEHRARPILTPITGNLYAFPPAQSAMAMVTPLWITTTRLLIKIKPSSRPIGARLPPSL
jgi:hypothetical protein